MTKVRSTRLNVEGMRCGSCARHVGAALRAVEGVRLVDVRLREGEVFVEHDGEGPGPGSLVEALREAGYAATAAGA